jgi:hypothetical protein
MTDAAPSAERLSHDRIERASEQIADALGSIGLPWKVEGPLARLERSGAIGARERVAGETFQRLFRIAALDPLHAAGMAHRSHAVTEEALTGVWARERVNRALDALGGLGSPCGSCAWFVLGMQLSVREWAMREGWGGRPVSPHVAKGTLCGTLGVLVRHFGL